MFAAGRDQDVVALNGWCYAELAAALVDGDGRLRDVPWEVLPLYRTTTATMATVGTISPFAMHYPNRAHPRRHPHGIRYLDCLAEINWKDYGLTGAFACGMVVQPPPPMKWLTPPLTVPQRAVLVVVVVVCCGRQEGFRRR